VEGGVTNGFKWVSLSGCSDSKLSGYVSLEGKYVTSQEEADVDSIVANERYDAGDREYTYRTDTGYYEYSSQGDDNSKAHYLYIHLNDFLRTSLDLDDRTEKGMNKFYLAIKTIEPGQLAEEPKWLDYADLIYIHEGANSNGSTLWLQAADSQNADGSATKVKRVTDTHPSESSTYFNNATFSSADDFSWEVAKNLFFKVNQLGKYDGSGTYGFAPLLFDRGTLDSMASASSSRYVGNSQKTVSNYHMEYKIMETYKTILENDDLASYRNPEMTDNSTFNESAYTEAATNCNIYKFLLMNFLMDQQNFYNYFFENARYTTGEPVLSSKDSDEVGLCLSQEEGDAQSYWNPNTFLPLADYQGSGVSDAKLKKYGIYKDGAYMNFATANKSLWGATFLYNSDNLLSQCFNINAIEYSSTTSDAFDWYKEEYGVSYTSMSPVQMIHYLLKYKKHGGSGEDENSRDQQTLRVLEIEPCAEFVMTATSLRDYLPKSSFSSGIQVDHMTTQEFNAYQGDINGTYDMVYIGICDGKFNKEDGSTVYNDSERNGKVYLHVGDSSGDGKLRASGSDISSLKKEVLQNYVDGGNAIILADNLARNSATLFYSDLVDLSSNMHKFINSYKSRGKLKVTNICALSDFSYTFLKNNTWKFGTKAYTLPTRTKTGLSKDAYAAFKEDYSEYAGYKYKILSTPVTYSSINVDNTTLSGDELNFSFMIGDKDTSHEYAIRVYMDTTYDGIISNNTKRSELVYDSINEKKTYTYDTEAATDRSGMPYTDSSGETIAVPKVYDYTFDIGDYYTKLKQLGRQSGSVEWKFVVYRVGNKQDSISVSGTSRYVSETSGDNSVEALQVVADADKDTSVNLNNNTSFQKLIENLPDYKISVTTITLSDFVKQCKVEDNDDYFGAYTILVISCGKQLQAEDEAAANKVKSLADNGIGVLYSGSTVSKDSKASDTVTQSLKDLLNLSRFTCSDEDYRDTNAYNSKKDTGTYTSLEYTYAAFMEKGSGKRSVYNWKGKVKYGDTASKADKIAQNNSGGWTNYPYTIDQKIEIAGTAAQDYQLNMDNENLTVWYSLGGVDADEADTTEYGISPKDGTNNYYLYTVDNVGYVGIDLSKQAVEEEMKLFINCIVNVTEYKCSYTTVNSVVAVKDGKTDGTVTPSMAPVSEEMLYDCAFSDNTNNSEAYSDYEGGDSVVSSSEPTEDNEPDDDDATATQAPDSSSAPSDSTQEQEWEEDPWVFQNDTGNKVNGLYMASSYVFSKYDDDAVFAITYDTSMCDKFHISLNYWINCDGFAKNDALTTTAAPDSTSTKEVGVYMVTMGEIRNSVKEKNSTLSSIYLYADNWSSSIITVAIYASESQLEYYIKGDDNNNLDASDSSVTNEEQDNTLVKKLKRTDVGNDSTKFTPEYATHRVYFTPYEGNENKNVSSLKISLVRKATATTPELTGKTIKKIYQDVNDTVGEHTWMYKASSDGTFTIKNLNFVQNGLEYYFFYDDHYSSGTPSGYYNITGTYTEEETQEDGTVKEVEKTEECRSTECYTIKFETKNRKKEGVTYVDMTCDSGLDQTYVFKLD
jgi:hypothetical protein